MAESTLRCSAVGLSTQNSPEMKLMTTTIQNSRRIQVEQYCAYPETGDYSTNPVPTMVLAVEQEHGTDPDAIYSNQS
jgi:hypothetical protein